MTLLRKLRNRPKPTIEPTETISSIAQPEPKFLDPEQIITVKVSKPKPKSKAKPKAQKKAKKKKANK